MLIRSDNVKNMRTFQIFSYIEVDYKDTQVLLTNCEVLGVQVCEKLDSQVIINGHRGNWGLGILVTYSPHSLTRRHRFFPEKGKGKDTP